MSTVFDQEATVADWDHDYYHPISLRLYDQAVVHMLKVMRTRPGVTVLDAGCGPGVHSIRVAKAGCRVCAIDLSDTMLRHASQRICREGVENLIQLHRGDLTRLHYAEASFDYIFSWGVIIHIPEADLALAELARVLKPHGRLALYVNSATGLDSRMKSLGRALLRNTNDGCDRLNLGNRMWYRKNGDRLCAWDFKTNALSRQLHEHGLRRISDHVGEFSQLQRHTTGWLRDSLLHLNNLAFRVNFAPWLGATRLIVFEKQRSAS